MVDNTSYAINVSSVLEVLNMTKPTAVPCALSYIEGLIYSREQGITVVNLRKRFELGEAFFCEPQNSPLRVFCLAGDT